MILNLLINFDFLNIKIILFQELSAAHLTVSQNIEAHLKRVSLFSALDNGSLSLSVGSNGCTSIRFTFRISVC